jgi:hypothetical protein
MSNADRRRAQGLLGVLVGLLGGCSLLVDLSGYGPLATTPDAAAPDASMDAPDGAPCHADLTSDPSHCGACDHDCHGGSCTAGTCDALVIASGRVAPEYVAVQGTRVYWNESGPGLGLFTVDLSAPGAAMPLVQADVTGQVVIHGGDLYWATLGQIQRCPLPGNCFSAEVVAALSPSNLFPHHFAVGDARVYVAVESTNPAYWLVELFDLAAGADAGPSRTIVADAVPAEVDVTAYELFFVTNHGSSSIGNLWGPLADGGIGKLFSGVLPASVQIGDASVFFSVRGFHEAPPDGRVLRQDFDSGVTTEIVSNVIAGTVRVADGVVVYADLGARRIVRVASDGGSPLVLWSSATEDPVSITLADGYVYLSTANGPGPSGANGRVLRFPM